MAQVTAGTSSGKRQNVSGRSDEGQGEGVAGSGDGSCVGKRQKQDETVELQCLSCREP
jgi:hypothetical protein